MWNVLFPGLTILSACRPLPDTLACRAMAAPAPGPLAAERAQARRDPLRMAGLFMDEGFRTSDDGFYALAEQALLCAADAETPTPEWKRLQAELWEKAHRFADSAALFREIALETDDALDYADLAESLMNLGDLGGAAEAMQEAANRRTTPLIEGRIAMLRFAWGDLDGAIEMADRAARDPDPVVRAWALAHAGWYRALRGEPSPQLDAAIALLPDYATARLWRGLVRLHAGDAAGAGADLRAAGRGFEAQQALAELEPGLDPTPACASHALACASFFAEKDPARALALLDEELRQRRDAPTRIARAYAAGLTGEPVEAELREALATGTIEPRALLQAGLALGDAALLERALAMGPGLLPSERARAKLTLESLKSP